MQTMITRFGFGRIKPAPREDRKRRAWEAIRTYLEEHRTALGATLTEALPDDAPRNFVYYCYQQEWLATESPLDSWLRAKYPDASDEELDDMARMA